MTIGIYSILNVKTSQRYVGKSKNIESRFAAHKSILRRSVCAKDCNRHLFNSFKKYGESSFEFSIVEVFEVHDEVNLKLRELYWMDEFKTCDREFGFNLRRDSSTNTIVHPETLALMKLVHSGEQNGNFGNYWTDAQRARMSEISKARHAAGVYGEEWRRRQGVAASKTWESQVLRDQMAKAVSKAKMKFDFLQFDRSGKFIRKWASVAEIVSENPTYKWQNIYSVCNGYKNTYHNFVWKKVLKRKRNVK